MGTSEVDVPLRPTDISFDVLDLQFIVLYLHTTLLSNPPRASSVCLCICLTNATFLIVMVLSTWEYVTPLMSSDYYTCYMTVVDDLYPAL